LASQGAKLALLDYAMIPAGRIGEPDEIAHTVQYIIENDFVNGRNFEVDGGMRL
jgi:3-oxoacyl-[acyl-carrier protein] reductase